MEEWNRRIPRDPGSVVADVAHGNATEAARGDQRAGPCWALVDAFEM